MYAVQMLNLKYICNQLLEIKSFAVGKRKSSKKSFFELFLLLL